MGADPPPQMSLSVTVFVDLAELLAGLGGQAGGARDVDWGRLFRWLATDGAGAALSLPADELFYSHARVYVLPEAVNAGTAAEAFVGPTAADFTVVRVKARPALGDCLACDLARTPRCNRCRNMGSGAGMLGGPVSDAMAADIFRLVREGSLDVAVLVSADQALASVIRFLEGRGKRTVHAAFPPRGRELSAASTGVVDLRLGRS